MNYGSRKTEKTYLTTKDMAEFFGVPSYQIGRWQKKFGLIAKRNRAGQRIFLEKDRELLARLLKENEESQGKQKKKIQKKVEMKNVQVHFSSKERQKVVNDLKEILGILQGK